MYFIRFNVDSEEQKVLVRNKRRKEDFNNYQEYVTKIILNKMAKVLVTEEELENGYEYRSYEYRKRVAYYKKEYADVACIVANEKLEERYPDVLVADTKERHAKKSNSLDEDATEDNQTQEYRSYTMDELAYLMHKDNPKINFWYDSKKKNNKIFMDEDDLSVVNLPEGYYFNNNNSIVDSNGNIIYVEDVAYSNKYSIKKSSKFTSLKLSLKNLVKPFSKKSSKKDKEERAIHNEIVENFDIEEPSIYDEIVENYSSVEEQTEQQEERSIHDEIVENFDIEEPSIYDEIVENFELEEQDHLPKYPEKEIHDEDILSMNVYSNNAKNEVIKKKANSILDDVLTDDSCILTRDLATFINTKFNLDINAFDVDLNSVNCPPRQLDCGCGMIEIYGDEFEMLIESKYEALKENEEVFSKLPKAQRESFAAYYKKELKNAFDYSNKGKVKLMKTEYDNLLKIHNDYFKLCTIRREREHLLKVKNAYIEKQVQKLIEEIDVDFQTGEKNLSKAEAKYMSSLEKVQPVKVIKK